MRGACATPDTGDRGGAPLLRARLASRVRGGADEVSAEVYLPQTCGRESTQGASPALHKVATTQTAVQERSALRVDRAGHGVLQGR